MFDLGSLKSPPNVGGGHLTEIPSPTLTVNEEEDSDDGEPLLSGFGEVSKECSGNELEMWSQMLQVILLLPFLKQNTHENLITRTIIELFRSGIG